MNTKVIKKKKKSLSAVTIFVTLIFIIYLLIFLVPYVYALFASLSNYKEYYFNIFPIPKEGLKLMNYLEQAVELADLIFDNNLDKVYFLRQYIKSFEKGTKPFARAKRPITATNIPKN